MYVLDFRSMSKEELIKICEQFRQYIEYNLGRQVDSNELLNNILRARASGLSMEKIGQKYGISRQRVHQILNKNKGQDKSL